MVSRIAILKDGFIPAYRVRFFESLVDYSDLEYVVIHGDPTPGSGHPQLGNSFRFPNKKVKNRTFRIGNLTAIYQPVHGILLNGKFDAVVFGHETKLISNLLHFFLFKVFRKPVLIWGHGFHKASDGFLSRLSYKFLSRFSDGYLVYTDQGATRLAEAGVSRERITVVRNTLDTAGARRASDRLAKVDPQTIKTRMDIAPSAKVLLFVGRLEERKRADELLSLMQHLSQADSIESAQLLIVGEGPEKAHLEESARHLDCVRFLGGVYDADEIGRIMRIATAVIIPGATGLAINHAFAHGVPVITRSERSHGPEIEYVRHGENGLIIDGDLDLFHATVASFLTDEDMQKRLASEAFRTGNTLDLDYMVRQFDRGVNEALDRRQRVVRA